MRMAPEASQDDYGLEWSNDLSDELCSPSLDEEDSADKEQDLDWNGWVEKKTN